MKRLFCGIDVAKYEHVASIYDPATGEYILDSLHFENNEKGFDSLVSNLSKLKRRNDVMTGFESTGHYHMTLFSYLTERGYKCYLINPYMTSRFRSVSLRDAKNDDIDSRAIAVFLSFEYQNLENEEFFNNELKELSYQRHFLITDSSKMKIKLKSYLDRVFPELEGIVNIHTEAIRAILKEYPSAEDISKVRIDRLQNLAYKASRGKYPLTKIEKLREAAKVSVGYPSGAIALNIRHCIETLEIKERQIEEVESMIINHPSVFESPLKQLKGMNDIEIGYIMSAIISISRFDSYKKLTAYAGLDPKIRQSGTWNASTTRMSKRGNKLLRYALIWSAYNMTRCEGPVKDYYELKRLQGKSHYNALGHCAAKLCRYIFWILNHPQEEFIYR
ncbi:MAG: IS110 family transposase [Erysipelotrichaceae bacterium]|nr:IS110 family transposase [Erysipelotrichaceae bacterium]MBR0439120.1 IS110 family transposase [Clostridia bacterium]